MCSLVCGGSNSPPPLAARTLSAAGAGIVAAPDISVLLTPRQAIGIGARIAPISSHHQPQQTATSVATEAPVSTFRGATAVAYSEEYVYLVSALVACKDRAFRKACRRMDAAMAAEGLQLQVYTAATLTKDVIGRCIRCRNKWRETRLLSQQQQLLQGKYVEGDGISEPSDSSSKEEPKLVPPHLPKKSYYLSALMRNRFLADRRYNPAYALFVLVRRPSAQAKGQEQV